MEKQVIARDGKKWTVQMPDIEPASDRDRYIVESPLSTRALAEELGLSQSTVSRIRRGVDRHDPVRRVVYFIAGGGLIKIGKSGNVATRLPLLQCGSPVPLTLLGTRRGYTELEAALHARFADKHSHGEWFDVTLAEIEEFLAELDSAAA